MIMALGFLLERLLQLMLDRLILLPPFCAAGGAMGFYDGTVDQIQAVARFRCQGVENPLPDAASRPTIEGVLYAVVWGP